MTGNAEDGGVVAPRLSNKDLKRRARGDLLRRTKTDEALAGAEKPSSTVAETASLGAVGLSAQCAADREEAAEAKKSRVGRVASSKDLKRRATTDLLARRGSGGGVAKAAPAADAVEESEAPGALDRSLSQRQRDADEAAQEEDEVGGGTMTKAASSKDLKRKARADLLRRTKSEAAIGQQEARAELTMERTPPDPAPGRDKEAESEETGNKMTKKASSKDLKKKARADLLRRTKSDAALGSEATARQQDNATEKTAAQTTPPPPWRLEAAGAGDEREGGKGQRPGEAEEERRGANRMQVDSDGVEGSDNTDLDPCDELDSAARTPFEHVLSEPQQAGRSSQPADQYGEKSDLPAVEEQPTEALAGAESLPPEPEEATAAAAEETLQAHHAGPEKIEKADGSGGQERFAEVAAHEEEEKEEQHQTPIMEIRDSDGTASAGEHRATAEQQQQQQQLPADEMPPVQTEDATEKEHTSQGEEGVPGSEAEQEEVDARRSSDRSKKGAHSHHRKHSRRPSHQARHDNAVKRHDLKVAAMAEVYAKRWLRKRHAGVRIPKEQQVLFEGADAQQLQQQSATEIDGASAAPEPVRREGSRRSTRRAATDSNLSPGTSEMDKDLRAAAWVERRSLRKEGKRPTLRRARTTGQDEGLAADEKQPKKVGLRRQKSQARDSDPFFIDIVEADSFRQRSPKEAEAEGGDSSLLGDSAAVEGIATMKSARTQVTLPRGAGEGGGMGSAMKTLLHRRRSQNVAENTSAQQADNRGAENSVGRTPTPSKSAEDEHLEDVGRSPTLHKSQISDVGRRHSVETKVGPEESEKEPENEPITTHEAQQLRQTLHMQSHADTDKAASYKKAKEGVADEVTTAEEHQGQHEMPSSENGGGRIRGAARATCEEGRQLKGAPEPPPSREHREHLHRGDTEGIRIHPAVINKDWLAALGKDYEVDQIIGLVELLHQETQKSSEQTRRHWLRALEERWAALRQELAATAPRGAKSMEGFSMRKFLQATVEDLKDYTRHGRQSRGLSKPSLMPGRGKSLSSKAEKLLNHQVAAFDAAHGHEDGAACTKTGRRRDNPVGTAATGKDRVHPWQSSYIDKGWKIESNDVRPARTKHLVATSQQERSLQRRRTQSAHLRRG
eukprot:TRINITY_DN4042_c0_g1_i4.p1 TRINITY_DN4042_c0_g1~~TRINITY_DN4042_c0_g1_i4.p1  ORF type:complete len:1131 (-),score=279.34 TRINITY_DN4042_c0_g1_i4:271-3663(-)